MSKKAESKKPKVTISIYAPPYFGERELGTTIASSVEQAIGRVIRVSLYQLTDDFSKQYLLINFKIVRVEDLKAYTIFYGHEYGREFLRSLVRRGTSRIDGIFDVMTKDGFKLRLTVTAFTFKRASRGQERAIRRIMREVVTKAAESMTLDQLSQEMVLGKTASDIYNLAKKIVMIRHLGIIKSKVLKIPDYIMQGTTPTQQLQATQTEQTQ